MKNIDEVNNKIEEVSYAMIEAESKELKGLELELAQLEILRNDLENNKGECNER